MRLGLGILLPGERYLCFPFLPREADITSWGLSGRPACSERLLPPSSANCDQRGSSSALIQIGRTLIPT